MQRYYYLASDLDRVEEVSRALRGAGLDRHQLHVMSSDDAAVDGRPELNGVVSLMKRDLVASGLRGALVGAVAAMLLLLVAWLLDAFATPAGAAITLFASVATFGFCVWEGGFYGIQTHNRKVARFTDALSRGQHLLFVDVDPDQASTLERVMTQFPALRPSGSTRGVPRWLFVGQRELPRFLTQTMP